MSEKALPAAWLARLHQPLAEDRPLQIVHGIDATGHLLAALGQKIPEGGTGPLIRRLMAFYQECGLGGIVCNVSFREYLRSEENWQILVAGVEACRDLGLVVWIYDEEGYPSGSAGGLVLQEHPECEAQELAYDRSQPDPFILRPAYEYTHAANNYYASRRYINLIDDRGVRAFIAKTHQAYRHRLGAHFGTTVSAFFTDEPSLIAVNLGQIPEPARQKVPVVDPVDPTARPLPAVPWGYDLPERYQERYGEDLMASRLSLFAGQAEADRRVRRQYWALIADLVADRYFGALGQWCTAAGVASSGHTLWEESILHHPALEGNGLKALSRMEIPGLDLLSSDPEVVFHRGWLTAALPASAALLTGRRRVMTEVSDFSEKMGGQGPAGLLEMQATAAWQAAWGVTDFALYYDLADRPVEDCRAYCNYVGRLNAILKPAVLDPEILLYYPVWDLWAEYCPVAEPLSLESQTPRAQRLIESFNRLGQTLTRSQIPFALIDHEFLSQAEVAADGSLCLQRHSFRGLVLPEEVELPEAAAAVVARFCQRGGQVWRDLAEDPLTGAALADLLRPSYRLIPASEKIVLGRFVRDRRPVLLLVNVGRREYTGQLLTSRPGSWCRLDPATGVAAPAIADLNGRLPLAIGPRQAVLLVGEAG